jgi:LexA-binding, inner membrane-associated putative hydrolase
MHTYSHAIYTWAVVRFARWEASHAAAAGAAGAALPDLPTVSKASRLLWSRRDTITKKEFLKAMEYFEEPSGRLDLTLHSLVPVGSLLVLYKALGLKDRDPHGALLFFLLGWAGHNLLDITTHAEDARPPFWPFSGWRWKSPISYWDRDSYALQCLVVEHGAILALALVFLYQSYRA